MNLEDIKKLLDGAKTALDGHTVDFIGLAIFLGKLGTSILEAVQKAKDGSITDDDQQKVTDELHAILQRIIEKTA